MPNTTSHQAVLFVVSGLATILAGCTDDRPAATEPANVNTAAIAPALQADKKTLKRRDDVQIVRATGDITAAVEQYQHLLGDLSPNLPGVQLDRREINWDGAALKTNTDDFPGDFFRGRGILFTTDGTGFRISDNGYVDVNPGYAGEFNFFSRAKIFVARGSTTIDNAFVVAGSNTPAVVTGFGAVFEDVGRAHSTTIEYFDASGKSLLKIAVPRRSDANGQSFAGAVFDQRIVAQVRITAGDTPIGPTANDNVKGAGPKRDIVTTDDFIYGEPHPIN